ncbi:MAG: type IV pilus assembly protein PilM [Fimbriimonas ginsengisoli]|uniref:Type IV pilus assembly protein PilM n=1 Tax=Fimbriimonas ginsengisoli TaxID=1005039 RepID=A0A931LSQ9_FIMGI|nr:type IV pilus assembly protein PilM [Fimbriimonas ginsengisoli]MBI3721586.1 type IV pilus assembly protein PilM [Fimbriimonas ginsengisoli]
MAKKLTSVVGIDIGSSTIKLAELRLRGGAPEISALGLAETPEGAVDHTGVYNSEAVGDALKALFSECGASVGVCVAAIAGQASVLVRTLEVPRMSPTELREHMQWEISRNVPFADSNVVSDFKVLPEEDPNSPNMDVVMAIAPQAAIDTIINAVRRAGRACAAIDVEPLAIARSLQTSYDDLADKAICIVDLGHKTTAINIYRNGKLLMPRQIPVGGEMFTKAISDHLGISMEEAERMKVDKAVIPKSAIEASRNLAADVGFGPMPQSVPPAGGETQGFQAYNPFSDQPIAANPFTEPQPAPHSFAAPDQPAVGVPEPNPFAAPGEGASAEPSAPTPNPFADQPTPTGADQPAQAPAGGTALPDHNPFEAPDAAATGVLPGDSESIRLFNAYSATLDEFVAEVRRSIDYFRSRGGDVDRIMLSGGGTRLRGLTEYLHANLDLPCDPYNPLERLNLNDKKVAPGYAEEHAQEFTVAVGTALHIFFD